MKEVLSRMVKNHFVLLVSYEENEYSQLKKVLKSSKKADTKICYICLSKPYKDVVHDLKEKNINTDNFFFIDTLSSHYGKIKPKRNCIFLPDLDLALLKEKIIEVIEKKKCGMVLFDTISTLLIYQKASSIISFTHNLLTDTKREDTTKVFIVLKTDSVIKDENKALLSDLSMFADAIFDINS